MLESQHIPTAGETEVASTISNDPAVEISKEGGGSTAERLRKDHRTDKKRRLNKKKERNEKIKVVLVQVCLVVFPFLFLLKRSGLSRQYNFVTEK